MHKLIVLLCLFFTLSGCGYFGDGIIAPSPTIQSIENTDDGILLRFDPGTSDDISFVTVEYRAPGDAYTLSRQIVIPAENNERVIFTGPDDGEQFIRIIVATEDLYGTSEETAFTVVSPIVRVPCQLEENRIVSNVTFFGCNNGTPRVRGMEDRSGDEYVITANCSGSTVEFAFPRRPTSGVYQAMQSITFARPREKVVQATVTDFNFRYFEDFAEIYVQNTEAGIRISFCDTKYGTLSTGTELTIRGDIFLSN